MIQISFYPDNSMIFGQAAGVILMPKSVPYRFDKGYSSIVNEILEETGAQGSGVAHNRST